MGHDVNRKRVQRLMRLMGISAIYPKPRLSQPESGHEIYPYLLRKPPFHGGLSIDQGDQVWCSDCACTRRFTYVRLLKGFMYWVVVMDWLSRYVLSWQLSNTLDADFCVRVLKEALCENQPEIFNTDHRRSPAVG